MPKRAPASIPMQALTGAVLAAVSLGVYAQSNLGFLHDTPASYFTKADTDSLTKAVKNACASAKDGASVTWNKEGRGTPISATLTPQTQTHGSHTCRVITTEIVAKGQSMTLKPMYCKTDDGQWRFQKR